MEVCSGSNRKLFLRYKKQTASCHSLNTLTATGKKYRIQHVSAQSIQYLRWNKIYLDDDKSHRHVWSETLFCRGREDIHQSRCIDKNVLFPPEILIRNFGLHDKISSTRLGPIRPIIKDKVLARADIIARNTAQVRPGPEKS